MPEPHEQSVARRSPVESARHRVVTRLRLLWMAPRRRAVRRALADPAAVSAPIGIQHRSDAHPGAGTAPSAGAGAGSAARVLVVAHVYYPELWDELAECIRRIPEPVDLVVTLVAGRAEHVATPIRSAFPGADVRVLPNRGRDIWPFVQVLDRLPGHDVVLKIHTKRSPHMRSGEQWRAHLLGSLTASAGQIREILTVLRGDPRIGMVVPDGNALGREFIANNGELLAGLQQRGGRRCPTGELWFPAGSMFWARTEVLAPLTDLHLTADDFTDESGATDGTLPHALERYLGVLVASAGRLVVETGELALLPRAHVSQRSADG